MGERFIDITPRIGPDIQVWPGDTPYRSSKSARMSQGDQIDLGAMHTTYHVGAHTDAPQHYRLGGADAARLPLDPYVGPCQVLDVKASHGKRYGPDALVGKVDAPRVLLRTGTFDGPRAWNNDFAAPEPALIDHLAALGVILVGFDTPSTDAFDSKDLPSHQRLGAHGMMNLEGLDLAHVEPGHYDLIALPLPLEDADASPVRAVLMPR
jgi:arylformamidase